MVDEIRSATLEEDEEELGEGSDSDGETEAASSLRRRDTCFVSKSPLYDFSSVVEDPPPKKGLSKFYQGKSQSFTSLLEVKSLEDLPKHYMEVSCGRKTNYAVGLGQTQKPVAASDTCIKSNPKKAPPSNASCASSIARSNSHGFLSHGSSGRPPVPLHKRQ